MTKLVRPAIMISLSLCLALFTAALACSAPVVTLPNLSGATFQFQVTPTPQVTDRSESGSTDEIVVMGGVIAIIIFTPILISRKRWRQ